MELTPEKKVALLLDIINRYDIANNKEKPMRQPEILSFQEDDEVQSVFELYQQDIQEVDRNLGEFTFSRINKKEAGEQ